MKTTIWGDNFSQAGDASLALAVIEHVEKPAVEHGVELLTEIKEAKGICDDEARLRSDAFAVASSARIDKSTPTAS